jgi:hypothetical protein
MSYEDEEQYENSDGDSQNTGNELFELGDGDSQASYQEVFEVDDPKQREADIKANPKYYSRVAAEEYSDEESSHGVESPILAEYTFTNVIWNYENKSIPDDINLELLEIIDYTDCPFNDDKTPINIIMSSSTWYFEGLEGECYIDYTINPGSKTCSIDVFNCNHKANELIPPGSGRCLLLKLLQSLIIEKQIEEVIVTAKPEIYESDYGTRTPKQRVEYEKEQNIKLRKYYNDIGFMPITAISDTTSEDNKFTAPILQIIYNILIYRKSAGEIDIINRSLNSDSAETAGGYKKTKKTKKRRHKKTKKTKKRRHKKTKRRQTKKR